MTSEWAPADMPVFPSDAWVDWLDAALSECRVDDTLGLALEYHASDDDASVFCWHVRIASGRVSAAAGRAGEAHGLPVVTLASDRDTARTIAIEGGSAQRAFAEGRLQFSGDPRLLLAARPVLEAIGAILAGKA